MEDIVVTCSGIMVEFWILNSGYWQQNGGNFSKGGICDITAKKCILTIHGHAFSASDVGKI